jgi:type IV secretion system protein TrbL
VGTVSLKSEAASRSVRMVRTALGLTITGWLEDPAIVEVMLNPDGRLWIDRLIGGLLVSNFNGLAKIVFNSFSGLGLKAAGSGLSADQFLQPGRITQVGIDVSWPILQAVSSLVGFTAIINPGTWLQLAMLLVALVVVVGSFFVLAIQLFVTLIEFKLTTLAGFVLVPFGLLGQTAFLAERVLGNAVASGVKIRVLAVIVGIGTNLFSQFTQGFGGQPALQDVLAIALAALSLLGLGIYGPGIATGLAAGAPQLGAGAAIGTVSTAWVVGGAPHATVMAAGSAATGISGAVLHGGPRAVSFVSGRGFSTGSDGGKTARPVTPAVRRLGAPEESQGVGALGWALRDGDRGGAATPINARAPEPHDSPACASPSLSTSTRLIPCRVSMPSLPNSALRRKARRRARAICSPPPARGSGRRRLRRPLLLRTRAFTKRINRSQSKRHMHD